ncbi:hypothetical protein ACFODT_14855 [Vibrio zhugei]|uniref:Uncharacterized protein n=1 Tax=Vibrio zhugei TaxID=2479546 RepID=A0ABV7CDJ8_9VIBR|nr:hypothetical protein [Vibrio zhugei]
MTRRIKTYLSTITSLLALVLSGYIYFASSQQWALNLFVLLGSAIIIHRYCCAFMPRMQHRSGVEQHDK